MHDLMEKMTAVLAHDVDGRHSLFQLEHFILGKEFTHQGKLWQCFKEIRSRKASLENIDLEIEESSDQIELLNIQCEAESEKENLIIADEDSFFRKYRIKTGQVTIRQLHRKLVSAKKNLGSLLEQRRKIAEESEFFVKTFDSLEKIEKVKALDDVDAQKEYWTAKLSNEVHLKMLLGQPLDVELVKTVLSLNDDSPIKNQMISIIKQLRDDRLKIGA